MTATYGYARVSTADQQDTAQIAALTKAGCSYIFRETVSGTASHRPALAEMLATVEPGDTIVVYRFDRIARSLKQLVTTLDTLAARSVHFHSLTEAIDTATPTGKFMFHICAAMAEFERDLIRQRTKDGLAAARARGSKAGRPKALSPDQIDRAKALRANGLTMIETARALGVARSTLTRALAHS